VDGFRQVLAAEFSPYRTLSSAQLDALERHFELLNVWNQKINLTRIISLDEAVRLHYCESLFLGLKLPHVPLTIADVGSGAGFPGIPLAILRSDCRVDLIEADQRKAAFLREASRTLDNVKVLALRSNLVSGAYDWLISRAVRREELFTLSLAPNIALVTAGEKGEPIPWGDRRRIEFISRETVSRETAPFD
jgi:16S rRNA (guanine(527)-N(7))-methyltransferase RsmG